MQLGHLDRLLLSCDGRIPGHIRDALAALDREEAARRPATIARVKANLVRLKPAGEIECLAEAMLRIARRKGTAEWRDLVRAGFTAQQLRIYGNRAVARAAQLMAARERRS